MIQAEHSLVIGSSIDNVWDYVKDIEKWAQFFPGCRECTIIDDRDSLWILKVGAGGMVKTVNVFVHVDQWAGPERVNFSFKLEAEPVVGGGSYVAASIGSNETQIALSLNVEGSGQMAPMWEAVSKPLLPQLAKTFAGKLKSGIEEAAGVTAARPALPARIRAWLAALARRVRNVWRAIRGSETK